MDVDVSLSPRGKDLLEFAIWLDNELSCLDHRINVERSVNVRQETEIAIHAELHFQFGFE